jgi:hypothetical protein
MNTANSAEADGMAALGICESLLLALTDLNVITEEAARGLLQDVLTTHEEAVLSSRHQTSTARLSRLCNESWMARTARNPISGLQIFRWRIHWSWGEPASPDRAGTRRLIERVAAMPLIPDELERDASGFG